MHKNTKDLKGLRFGRLMVIKLSEKRGERNQIKWDCICDCGNLHTVTAESLSNNKSKSCGCLLIETRKSKIDRKLALQKNLYSHIKTRYHKRFDHNNIITFSKFCKLIEMPCHYCGKEPYNFIEDIRHDSRKNNKTIKVSDTILYYSGIDRIDSKIGYIDNNVLPCCRRCNVAKMDFKYSEFIEWVKDVYNNTLMQELNDSMNTNHS